MPDPCAPTGSPRHSSLQAGPLWGGSGTSWREARVSTLTFYSTRVHLNFEPPPRSWYVTERGRTGVPGLPPGKGIGVPRARVFTICRFEKPETHSPPSFPTSQCSSSNFLERRRGFPTPPSAHH
ncbi:unnamed protein product [Pipistrellus nathusii]|uniref:Uncharacterized protein n=1 Tax=Pipistrellus nathusii TaxID=59473 RepID=A0ABP0A9C5_PIPNA